MRWFKVAAIAVGVVIAFLIVSSVIGFLMEAAIAALVVATVVLAVKVAFYRGQVSRNRRDSEVRGPTYSKSTAPSSLAGCRRRARPTEARDGRLAIASSLVAPTERNRHRCGRRQPTSRPRSGPGSNGRPSAKA